MIDQPQEYVGTRFGWSLWVNVACVECPRCAFTFDADHTNQDGTSYSCPLCDEVEHSDGPADGVG